MLAAVVIDVIGFGIGWAASSIPATWSFWCAIRFGWSASEIGWSLDWVGLLQLLVQLFVTERAVGWFGERTAA